MKTLRKLFKPMLALAVLASAVPSWACVRACDGNSSSLACVKACAVSDALLSDDGQSPLLSAKACAVASFDATPVLSVEAFKLSAPVAAAFAVEAVSGVPVLDAVVADATTRGPPSASSYLSSRHPFANGPPTLL
jgi:hypothetical protein